jgi:hypothetical protein
MAEILIKSMDCLLFERPDGGFRIITNNPAYGQMLGAMPGWALARMRGDGLEWHYDIPKGWPWRTIKKKLSGLFKQDRREETVQGVNQLDLPGIGADAGKESKRELSRSSSQPSQPTGGDR